MNSKSNKNKRKILMSRLNKKSRNNKNNKKLKFFGLHLHLPLIPPPKGLNSKGTES